MAHILEYLGSDNNTYVKYPNGSSSVTNAYVQTLKLGDTIETGMIGGDEYLAEQTSQYPLYTNKDHDYFIWDTLLLQPITDEYAKAEKMPNYLRGWETSEGEIFSDSGEFNQTVINQYFNGSNNLNVYGIWGETHLIRVIVYIPENIADVPPLYAISLTATSSYNTLNNYFLPQGFKKIRDNGNNLEFTNGKVEIIEVGRGDGCKKNDGVTTFVTYYGVKNGDETSIEIIPCSTSYSPFVEYIPYFEENNNIISYYCYIADRLTRNETYSLCENCKEELEFDSLNMIWSNNIQTSNLHNITTDKTVLIPLRKKPEVTVSCNPLNSGILTGNGFYLPGTSCTITATPNANYVFSEWEITSESLVVSSNPTYTFSVYNDISLTAHFVYIGTKFYFSWLCANSSVDLSSNVSISINNSAATSVSGTPQEYEVDNNTSITIEMDKIGLLNANFESIRVYSGDERKPQLDRGIGISGVLSSGVAYNVTELNRSTVTLNLDFSNVFSNSVTKLYAYYDYRI